MGRYLNMIRQVAESQKQITPNNEPLSEPWQAAELGSVAPGCTITWQGADCTQRGPAVVDFVHTALDDGTVWAFCTVPGGWYAVQTKYVTIMEEGN